METYEIDVPYNKITYPPYSLDVRRMIKRVKKKLTKWLDKIEPEFTNRDALKLTVFDKRKDALYVTYEIVRDKWLSDK
jgi:hypothetical protein